MTVDSVGQHYDRLAELDQAAAGRAIHMGCWDEDGQGTLEQAMDRHTDLVLARTGLRAGERLLDVGCGYGQPALRAAREHGIHATGITNSAAQQEIAERIARQQPSDVAARSRFDFGDAARLPYPDACFDAAWAIESLLHMPDLGAVLAGIHRVLVPGGRLVIADVVQYRTMPDELRQLWRRLLVSEPHDAHAFTDMLEAAGFEVVGTEDLTARTRHSWQALAESFQRFSAPLPTERSGGDVETGPVRERLAQMAAALPRLDAAFGDCLGYVLVEAGR
ncbi:27-O-demethylrifamycin SV methyltransferase [Actinomadura vinacea]|uniref:27-O-demethylrifamycin SV methyltransferase n=1 Tax=Actinomadura vinacea TaxID=115336 RepID=A0ABP5X6M1_9ACTN